MARRRRATTRKTSGVRTAAREAALKQAAAAHHSRRLSDAMYKARGGKKREGKAYAERHRKAANRRHKVRKYRAPLDGIFGPDNNPLRWLTAIPGFFKKGK
jgi:hypothetical protein